MKFIAHRGNITGPDETLENYQAHILEALKLDFDVEVDVWFVDGDFFLGHGRPQYKTTIEFLKTDGLWCHAKNLAALYKMSIVTGIHYFWHQSDDFTLTSQGYIWTYPRKLLTSHSIAVILPYEDINISELSKCAGICSDNILEIRKKLEPAK